MFLANKLNSNSTSKFNEKIDRSAAAGNFMLCSAADPQSCRGEQMCANFFPSPAKLNHPVFSEKKIFTPEQREENFLPLETVFTTECSGFLSYLFSNFFFQFKFSLFFPLFLKTFTSSVSFAIKAYWDAVLARLQKILGLKRGRLWNSKRRRGQNSYTFSTNESWEDGRNISL